MKIKKVAVITGGSGFIGSHLCDKLLGEGMRVICLDNLITGSKNNIAHLKNNPNFDFSNFNVTKFIRIPGKVHYVLHLASLASPDDYLQYPIQTLKVGSLGTHNALGLAKEKRATFLITSTSEVYGDPLVHPQPESYWGNVNPIGVRGCYDESKRFAEAITMAYHRIHRIDTKIVRIFNTYGPRMRINDGRVVPNFIYQALHGKPLTVYGKGRQTRSFCYIDDMVEGIYKLLKAPINTPVNIGNPDEFTILEFAKLVIAMIPTNSTIVYKQLPADDPKQRKPDIRLARAILHWSPKTSLETGLRNTIPWFAAYPSA